MFKARQTLLLVGDVGIFVASFVLMVIVRFDTYTQSQFIALQASQFAWLFALWLVVFFIFDLYAIRRINPTPRTIGLIIAAMLLNTLVGVLYFYLLPQYGISPKTNLVIIAGASLVLVVAWRRIYYHLFSKRFRRRIVLLGSGTLMEHLAAMIARNPHVGTVVAQWETLPTDIAVRADLVIAHNISPQTLLAFAQITGTETLTLDEAYETMFAKIPLELMTDERALSYMTSRSTTASRLIYRVLEIVGASTVLLVASPFLAIAALAIYIEDGGPIFIKQHRVGKHGSLFFIYKLRSMRALAPDGSAETNGIQWASTHDPRITKIGHILRKTHLDEVPQMYNIIRGDIALVGPRAERPEFVQTLQSAIPYYYLRHTIKPGFTGWAQIKYRYARSIDDSKEKFEYDLYYLKNKSPLLDIGIVLKTLQIIFTH
jgi:lipopolysaccharide/colanic/teichoic acid biosynthesis glycosyltransferase